MNVRYRMTEFDRKLFPCDVRIINWNTYFYNLCHGIRKFIAKDQGDLATAFRRTELLHAIHIITKFSFMGLVIYVIYAFGINIFVDLAYHIAQKRPALYLKLFNATVNT